jgi:hypothetical protein
MKNPEIKVLIAEDSEAFSDHEFYKNYDEYSLSNLLLGLKQEGYTTTFKKIRGDSVSQTKTKGSTKAIWEAKKEISSIAHLKHDDYYNSTYYENYKGFLTITIKAHFSDNKISNVHEFTIDISIFPNIVPQDIFGFADSYVKLSHQFSITFEPIPGALGYIPIPIVIFIWELDSCVEKIKTAVTTKDIISIIDKIDTIMDHIKTSSGAWRIKHAF